MTQPLHDEQLEAHVLAYALQMPRAQRRARRLDARAFSIEANARVFLGLVRATDAGGVAGAADVLREARGDLSPQRISELADHLQWLVSRPVPAGFDLDLAIERLHDLAKPRRLAAALGAAYAAAREGDVTTAQSAIAALAAENEADGEAYRITDGHGIIRAALLESQRRTERSPVDLGPLAAVGRHLGPGDMVTIGGETGAGKSSVCLWIARRWFQATGQPMGVVSLEDRWHTWGDRYQSQWTGTSLLDTPYDSLPWAMRRVNDELDGIPADGIWLSEQVQTDLPNVLSAMRALAAKGARILCVDYVQEIAQPPRIDRAVHIASCARAIKSVAKALKLPLILCSQLTRSKAGAKREPSIDRLKESGDLENMSEGILLLWRESDEERAPAYLKVGKLKSSSARPRVELVRGKGGALDGFCDIGAFDSASALDEWRDP